MQRVTDRLCFRPFRPGDAPVMVAAMNDWSVAQWLTMPPNPYTTRDAEVWIAKVENDHARGRPTQFGVADRRDDRLMGAIGIELADRTSEGAIGYWLARTAWGSGYGTEMVRELCAYAFEDLLFDRLTALVDPDNVASLGVLAKCGFRRGGERRRHMPSRRGNTVMIEHELLRPGLYAAA